MSLYSKITLTKAAQYARSFEATVRVAKHLDAPTSNSNVNAINYRNNFNKRGRKSGSSNNQSLVFAMRILTKHRQEP